MILRFAALTVVISLFGCSSGAPLGPCVCEPQPTALAAQRPGTAPDGRNGLLTNGRGVHVMTFQTDSDAHNWLNDVIAIGEGSIDPERAVLAMRYYACVVDYLPSLETPTGR